jgi:hypothetical protein
MTKVKLFYLVMPWQIDYALLTNIQLKKSKYYLGSNIEITIDSHLNLSEYLIDWENSQLPKEFFIRKYNDLAALLKDYKHNSIIYDGKENYGLLDMQKIAYGEEFDYYIPMCPDMYFSEHLLFSLIEAAKSVKNKYTVITPEIYKMWDSTWDEITNKKYLSVPYNEWDKGDIFDVRYDLKTSDDDLYLDPRKLIIEGESNNQIAGFGSYIIERGRQKDQNYIVKLRQDLEYLNVNLFHKVGGFVSKDKLQIIIDSIDPTSTSPGVVLPS